MYTSGSEVQVRGNAADVNTLLRTFKINQLTVDYSTADVSQLTNGAPQTGQLLEVKGILNAGGTLVATLVKPEDILGVATADNVEISGIVTLFNSITDFEVGGIAVLTDGATEFNDILPEDIDVGSKLIVSGSLTNRVLLADTVRSTAQVKIESNVSSVGSSSLTLDGLTLLTVNVNDLTKILGAADTIVEIFPGDHVKIFGTSFSSGNATASKIIVKKQSKDTVVLRGPVEAVISGDLITVLGVTIDTGSTGSIPDNGFSLENGGPLTRLEFQSRVSVGDSVNAKGNLIGDTVNWQSIELGKSN